ncbi:hypothetical protein HPB50_014796 [Hyalomma asiaticum]|uniref:Uncharacterized protein n=1 Tax=Hyalomma asiaticum TaxID=266040 RepID=A0ACB7SEY2_HYAAI|nr:hypothetical protein HPB50_014796 [Hyalomma asiaticum]
MTIAIIAMGNMERKALNTFHPKPKACLRLLDDYSRIEKALQVASLLTHLNSAELNIPFACRRERDDPPSFFDLIINRTENSLPLSIYRTPTYTSRYLHCGSNHPASHKSSVSNALIRRTGTRYSLEPDRRYGNKILLTELRSNGCPRASHFIHKIIRQQKRSNLRKKSPDPSSPSQKRVCITYVGGAS